MRELAHLEKQLLPWLAASSELTPAAIVLGGSWNALSFARSLGRRGVPVLVLESTRLLGTYTRFANVLRMPPADEVPELWLGLLELIGTRLRTPGVLFPTGDVHTLLVARHEDSLGRRFRLLVPSAETVEQILDKRRQYGIAVATGIPVPHVSFPEPGDDLRELAEGITYPVLLKPYVSHAARKTMRGKVVVAGSPAQLVTAYDELARQGVPLMVQAIVPGEDTALFGYLAFLDREGRELAWVTKRKLRQNPPHFGDGSLQITVTAPEVADLSRRLLRAFDYRGFVGIEFKRDARDGRYYLMEINPRTVSGNQLAISAGVDFPWIGYRYLTATGHQATRPFRTHVKYVNEQLDVRAFIALRKTGALTLGQWLRSLRGTKAFALGAWDDPLPLLVGLWRFVRLVHIRAWQLDHLRQALAHRRRTR